MTSPEPRETWHIDTAHVGRTVLVFDSLESTSTTAAQLASHAAGGVAVLAGFQTSGRGQYGRVWQARPGTSLLLSVVLRPPPELCRPVILTAFAAVAVAEAIYELTGIQARVKWPNDVLLRGKKVCGILIENATATVIGLGLNLNQAAEDFAGSDLPDATSLALVSPATYELRTVATCVLQHLDKEYARLLAGERVAVEADWKWRVGLLGRQVVIEFLDGSLLGGRLREMCFDGLEVDLQDGSTRVIVPELVRHVLCDAGGS